MNIERRYQDYLEDVVEALSKSQTLTEDVPELLPRIRTVLEQERDQAS